MGKVTVYGASDDLIEIEGAIAEEFSVSWRDIEDDEGKCFLAFSDGTLLRVKYDGCWRFTPVAKGSAAYSKTEATDEDKDYSDRVTLDGDVRWVALANQHVLAKK